MDQITGAPPLNGERAALGEARPVQKSAQSIERADSNQRSPAVQEFRCAALKFREIRERGRFVCIESVGVTHA